MANQVKTYRDLIDNDLIAMNDTIATDQPLRMSQLLSNEINGNFFEDKFDLDYSIDTCIAFEYDLDELITLSKQLQNDIRPIKNANNSHLEQNNSSVGEGAKRTVTTGNTQLHPTKEKTTHILRYQQPTIQNKIKTPTKKLSTTKISTPKISTPKIATPKIATSKGSTPITNRSTEKPKKCISNVASEINLNVRSNLKMVSSVSSLKTVSSKSQLSRPAPKKHCCVDQKKMQKRANNNSGSQSARPFLDRFYNFEIVHPDLELIQTKTVFPKRIIKHVSSTRQESHSDPNVLATYVRLSDISEEKSEIKKTTQEIALNDGKEQNDPTWHDVLDSKRTKEQSVDEIIELAQDKRTQTSPKAVASFDKSVDTRNAFYKE